MSDPILACEEELRQAQFSGDVTALDRLLDDELVFPALEGSVVGKPQRSPQLSNMSSSLDAAHGVGATLPPF